MDRQQRKLAMEFMAVSNVSETVAAQFLRRANWNVQNALDEYFSSGVYTEESRRAPAIDPAKITALFNRFKDPGDSEIIGPDGVQRVCDELRVQPQDVVVLVFAWKLQAAVSCQFSRKEWIDGLTRLGCDTMDKLRNKLPDLRAELANPVTFREIYVFAHKYFRERPEQRTLPTELAIEIWRLLLEGKWDKLDLWFEYLAAKKVPQITLDQWSMLYDFTHTINSDMSNFDMMGAWPVLMDEFVEYYRKKMGLPDLPGPTSTS